MTYEYNLSLQTLTSADDIKFRLPGMMVAFVCETIRVMNKYNLYALEHPYYNAHHNITSHINCDATASYI